MNTTKSATITIPLRKQEEYYGPPSHTCAICGADEFSNARTGTTEFWICPDCCLKIGRLTGVRTDGCSNFSENPCDRCEVGWGSVSTSGVRSCHDECERFKIYLEQNALEATK